jgi:hypothetical protein
MTVRGSAAVLALACAAAGCGIGPGPRSAQRANLTVTRDYGHELLRQASERPPESEDAIRILDRNARVETAYGGRFVQSIDGLAGGGSGGHFDWFLYVNGVESPVGGGDYRVRGGDRVWWDYRDWRAAMRVPAVVGSWPEPFLHGFAGRRWPATVRCLGGGGACETVSSRLREAGVSPGAASGDDSVRVLVGPWSRVRRDGAAAQLDRGPGTSGVFARFAPEGRRWSLGALDASGAVRKRFGADAGLVAAVRSGDKPPTWLVTGTDPAGVGAAASLLDEPDLTNRYAVVTHGRHPMEVPLP